jgi:hypothetical protein
MQYKSRSFAPRLAVAILLLIAATLPAAEPSVTFARVPDHGLQPQVAVDAMGIVHLIYLTGDPARSDIFYRRSTDGGKNWSKAIRVNSMPGSAIALGTVRGPQLALGRGGSVHVAWMGSDLATPRATQKATPMLYTRLVAGGGSFEPQRNVVQTHTGLDGGGSIAADDHGNVFVGWHAPSHPGAGEQDRRVWVARSGDNGKTFAPEVAVSDAPTGACGCCGMKLFADGGKLLALYRGAAEGVNRGMYLIDVPAASLSGAVDRPIAPMKIGMCVMSTSALANAPHGVIAAWETKDQVFWSALDPQRPESLAPHSAPGASPDRKHPALASDASGRTLLAWTEGTGWNKGGAVAWQMFDRVGQPVAGSQARADDLPAWDAPAAFAIAGRGFVILY